MNFLRTLVHSLIVENMFICLISPYKPQKGGVPVHTENLIKRLENKHKLVLITYGRENRKSSDKLRVIEVPVLNVKFLRGLSFTIGVYFKLRKLNKEHKIDVIHSQYMHPAGTVALLFRKFSKANPKVIVTAHGSDLLRLGQWILTRKMISCIGNKCNKLICVSEYLSRKAQEIGIRKENIKVIYNGIDSKELPKGSKKKYKEELNLPMDKKIITYAGSLIESKGADIFAILASHISGFNKKINFYMVGDGYMREWLKRYRYKKGIKNELVLVGAKNHENTLKYIKSSDILVVPSKIEGFGLSALEAMALEIPVVSEGCGALSEILSRKSITDNYPYTINKILNHAKFREDLKKENKKLSEKFNWEKTANETAKVYRMV